MLFELFRRTNKSLKFCQFKGKSQYLFFKELTPLLTACNKVAVKEDLCNAVNKYTQNIILYYIRKSYCTGYRPV